MNILPHELVLTFDYFHILYYFRFSRELTMSSVSIFEPGGDPGEAYYIADDGQLFTIAQASPIQDIRELPIASVHEQTIHKVEDLPGCPSAQNAEHGVELPYLVPEPPDPDMDDRIICDDPKNDNSKHQYFQQSQNQGCIF